MKRLLFLLFVVIISTSCNHLNDLRTNKLIVSEVYIQSLKNNNAIYTVRSYKGGEYSGTFKFTDDIGRFATGDTIKIEIY